ncbi:MAG: hypothetical protein M5R36_18875 [Deltaproteobacteria bacterium]|nr:hypothetical protein [Deltaproteobacteria bacterium]
MNACSSCGDDDDDNDDSEDDIGEDDDTNEFTPGSGCRLTGGEFADDLVLADVCPRNDNTVMLCCTEWSLTTGSHAGDPCFGSVACDSCYIAQTLDECAECEIHLVGVKSLSQNPLKVEKGTAVAYRLGCHTETTFYKEDRREEILSDRNKNE